jgi:multiple sugar transport system substrate-binding protein
MTSSPLSRRRFLQMSGAAITAAFLAACGGTPTATPVPTKAPAPATGGAAPGTMPVNTAQTGTFRYAIDNETETRKPATDLFFQKFYPNMTVAYEVTPDGYTEKLLASTAAGDPPHLAYYHESVFASFASQGAMLPLDDYLAQMPLIDGNDKYGMDIVKRNNTWQGKWYTLPFGLAFLFTAYNKTMFEQANIPVPKEGWTWDDFQSAMQKLTKDTKGTGTPDQWGWVGWSPGWAPAQWELMQSYGAFHFNDALDTCIINNDAGVQILDFMRNSWVGAGRYSPTPAQLGQLQSGTTRLFEGGAAAMKNILSESVNSTLANIAGSGKFDMGVEIYPAGPKGPFLRTGGSEMGLPKGDKYPQIGYELLRWLIGDEEAAQLAANYMEGNPLGRLDYVLKYNVPEGPLKDDVVRIITGGFEKYGTVVQYSKVGTYGSIWSANCDKMAAGEFTAKQCADAIASATNKELKG